jgi:hypothetical protein
MNKDEALDLALEALESCEWGLGDQYFDALLVNKAITAIRQARSAPVQEPKQSEIFCGVDFADGVLSVSVLRRRPDDVAELLHSEQIELQQPAAQRQWVGLTDDEILKLAYPIRWQEVDDFEADKAVNFAQMVEAKLKEKNGGVV